jgi:alpha-D-xyloside xylohydrolase
MAGPKEFRLGRDVPLVRTGNVRSVARDGTAISIECEGLPYTNAAYQWHETRVHRLMPEGGGSGRAGTTLHLEIRFWSAHVFRVRFSAAKPPWRDRMLPEREHRMLIGEPDPDVGLTMRETDFGHAVGTDSIELQIHSSPMRLKAVDLSGRVFWGQRRSDLLTSDAMDLSVATLGSRSCCFETFALGPQEEIFGLGERFDSVPRCGRAVDFWNQDVYGSSSARSYINVPFCFSTAGYGVFVNSSCRTEWEIGTLEAFSAGFGVEDDLLDYFVIHGPSPKEILHRYARLTGFAPLPPVWSFGLWMSRNSYLDWGVVQGVADGLRSRGAPADVLHLDTAWFTEDFNCDLRFSAERFPEPEKHFARLKAEGFRVSLWLWNFVSRREDNRNFVEGRERGFFATSPDGTLYTQSEKARGEWIDDAIIDFTNPDAVAWYTSQVADLLAMGASTIKPDFGESIPADAVFKETTGERFHNLYSLAYAASIFATVKAVTGDSIVWSRSGTAGSQRYPVHWGGDSQSTFEGLAGTLRGMLSAGLSGFSFFSHDIGGFLGRPGPELYVRWTQLGMFSSHTRCHSAGNDNAREPWNFGSEAEDIFIAYDRLRYRLLPYIYHQAKLSRAAGLPMARALVLEYPDDINTWRIQDQYLFGDAFLVAPVLQPLEATKHRKLYLPAGVWWDYWTKARIESRGEWIVRETDLRTMPLYVRAGSIVPYGSDRQCTHNRIGPVAALEVYSGHRGSIEYDDTEQRFTAEWDGSRLHASGLSDEVRPVVF